MSLGVAVYGQQFTDCVAVYAGVLGYGILHDLSGILVRKIFVIAAVHTHSQILARSGIGQGEYPELIGKRRAVDNDPQRSNCPQCKQDAQIFFLLFISVKHPPDKKHHEHCQVSQELRTQENEPYRNQQRTRTVPKAALLDVANNQEKEYHGG